MNALNFWFAVILVWDNSSVSIKKWDSNLAWVKLFFERSKKNTSLSFLKIIRSTYHWIWSILSALLAYTLILR